MRAAGPGKFSAKLKIRTPFKGRMGAVVDGAVAMYFPEALRLSLQGMIEAIMQAPFTRATPKRFH
jgi:hypothetical protein